MKKEHWNSLPKKMKIRKYNVDLSKENPEGVKEVLDELEGKRSSADSRNRYAQSNKRKGNGISDDPADYS